MEHGATLNPDAPVTFWQAAPMLMALSDQPTEGMSPREIAERAAELGLFHGPVPAEEQFVTRLDAAHMAAKLTNFTGAVEQKVELSQVFTDWEAIPAESRDLVYWVTIENRLFVGHPNRTCWAPPIPESALLLYVLLNAWHGLLFAIGASPPLRPPPGRRRQSRRCRGRRPRSTCSPRGPT